MSMAWPSASARACSRGRSCRSRPLLLPSAFPLLPLEEEGRLNDMPLRENFIERVFAYYRWTQMLANEPTPGGLVKFHTAHKLTRET
jgi:hypothetical protein